MVGLTAYPTVSVLAGHLGKNFSPKEQKHVSAAGRILVPWGVSADYAHFNHVRLTEGFSDLHCHSKTK